MATRVRSPHGGARRGIDTKVAIVAEMQILSARVTIPGSVRAPNSVRGRIPKHEIAVGHHFKRIAVGARRAGIPKHFCALVEDEITRRIQRQAEPPIA